MTSQDTAVTAPTPAVDETTEICLNYILKQYELHTSSPKASQPFFIGLNGIQGSGKTTLVSKLATILTDEKGLETLVLSIDDFYLTHAEQVALAQSHPNNKLVQHRGEPGRSLSPAPSPFPLSLSPPHSPYHPIQLKGH